MSVNTKLLVICFNYICPDLLCWYLNLLVISIAGDSIYRLYAFHEIDSIVYLNMCFTTYVQWLHFLWDVDSNDANTKTFFYKNCNATHNFPKVTLKTFVLKKQCITVSYITVSCLSLPFFIYLIIFFTLETCHIISNLHNLPSMISNYNLLIRFLVKILLKT